MAEAAPSKLSDVLDLKTAEALRAVLDKKYPLSDIAAAVRNGNTERAGVIAYSRAIIDDIDNTIETLKRKEQPRVLG